MELLTGELEDCGKELRMLQILQKEYSMDEVDFLKQ